MLELKGEVVDRNQELGHLRGEVERLEDELRSARKELFQVRNQSSAAVNAIMALRDILTPYRRIILAIWGEIELTGITEESQQTAQTSQPQNDRTRAAWQRWKEKLPGMPSKFIDALLEHGELSVSQLVVAAQCPRKQTIYDTASKLNRLGLINKNGDKYSLKEL